MRYGVLYRYYYHDIHPAHEAADVLCRTARAAAKEMWCTTVLLYYIYIYYYSINAMTSALPMRRPTGFHVPRHGPARVQPVPKRAEERFTVAMRYFRDPKFLVLPGKSRNNNVVRTAALVFLIRRVNASTSASAR